jgi:hypothetical protein
LIRNQLTQASHTVVTNSQGEFSAKFLTPGTYTVDAWHKFFERSSHPDITVTVASARKLDFNLDWCRIRHLDPLMENFATLVENKAKTDLERQLVSKAEQLSCSVKQKSETPLGDKPPKCVNLAAMRFYSNLVERNKNGHLPEEGEGPVRAGAYFGAVAEFDMAEKKWIVKLRLEYSVNCGELCGEGVVYTRWVLFDESKNVTKIADDCDCNYEWVS